MSILLCQISGLYSPWITTTNRAFWSFAVWMASPIVPWNQSMAINFFGNESSNIFYNMVHLNDKGQEMIAKKIFETIKNEIPN